ncbi:MAG: hypothetical protein KatS3mg040_0116 [Candidatus Kapaibacterium sp.]|nr:MAG: hypothetical protein KatS3mg040_0116 [Candidatus Kapabacteria bacterium]
MIRWFGFWILAVVWSCSTGASAQERLVTGIERIRHSSPAAWEALQRSLPRVLSADPDDRYWDPQFGPASTEQVIIQAIAVKGDTIVVGGYFRYFLGMDAYSLALWNGQRWMPLVEGGALSSTGGSGTISALAFGPRGELVIAGQFATIGGTAATNLAIYDWTGVRPLARSIDGSITTLAWIGDTLYVGGAFTSIDGVAGTNRIARWDGTSWSSVGGGIRDGNVSVLYADGTDLFVGGSFRQVGAIAAHSIARWDGRQWHALGDGLAPEFQIGQAQVLAIGKLWDGSVVAGGDFGKSGSRTVRNLARWDGTSWSELGPPDGPVTALLVDGQRLYISGGFETIGRDTIVLLAWWDGSRWHSMGGDQINGTAMAFAPFGSSILMGGSFDLPLADEFIIRGIAVWNGWTWLTVGGSRGNGLDGDVFDLLADAAGAVYVLGNFSNAGPVSSPRLARFTGARWQAVEGIPFNQQQRFFNRLSAYRDGTIAIASVFNVNNQPTPGLVLYDTSAKTTNVLATVGGSFTSRSIFCLTYNAERNLLYCGGNYRTLNGDSLRGIAVYDGQQWRGLGGGIASGAVYAVALLPDGSVIAGGNFSAIGGVPARSIARWNGSMWEPLGDGIGQGSQQGVVYAMLVTDGWLYVAGGFNRAGSVECANIARWNITSGTWEAIPGGTNGTIYTLGIYGDEIIVGGEFTRAGDTSANRIARYNPATGRWQRLGSGLEGTSAAVRALAVAGGALCVGGSFDLAGGRSSRGFARWLAGVTSVEREATESSRSNAVEFYPLPLGDRATARVQLDRDGTVQLDAYTLDGRYLGRLWEGWLSAGVHERSISLAGLPTGAIAIVFRRDARVLGTTYGIR